MLYKYLGGIIANLSVLKIRFTEYDFSFSLTTQIIEFELLPTSINYKVHFNATIVCYGGHIGSGYHGKRFTSQLQSIK